MRFKKMQIEKKNGTGWLFNGYTPFTSISSISYEFDINDFV